MIDPKQFALAGNATFTITSKKTGDHITYRIRQATDETGNLKNFWFASVLTGPDNTSHYSYIGHINGKEQYTHGKKSKIDPEDKKAKAFSWFWPFISNNTLPSSVIFQHARKCCRCGRKLTTPESIENGIGPECIKYV